jgi:small-conductance mechanosensitive channel
MDFAVWESAFASAVTEFLQQAAAYLPSLAAALALVLLGWVVAWLSRLIVSRLLGGATALAMRQPAIGRALERTGLGQGFTTLLSRVVFWFVLALFIAAAVERLHLPIAAALVSAFAAFLPRVLVGLVIVFAGIVAGQISFATVYRTAVAAGLPQAGLLARSVQLILVFFGIVTAADHVGIQSTLLTVVVATAVGAILGGATLAFGLGSRTAVSNIVAVFYLLKTYRVGQIVRIGDIEGEIVEITQTGVFIAAPAGRVLVPGQRFSEEASILVAGGRS